MFCIVSKSLVDFGIWWLPAERLLIQNKRLYGLVQYLVALGAANVLWGSGGFILPRDHCFHSRDTRWVPAWHTFLLCKESGSLTAQGSQPERQQQAVYSPSTSYWLPSSAMLRSLLPFLRVIRMDVSWHPLAVIPFSLSTTELSKSVDNYQLGQEDELAGEGTCCQP